MRLNTSVIILNHTRERLLFCQQLKDPYSAQFHFIKGKRATTELTEQSAYRILFEHTGIVAQAVSLTPLLAIKDDVTQTETQFFVGVLTKPIDLEAKAKPLFWLDVYQDFFDLDRFPGGGLTGYLIEMLKEATIF